MRTQLSAADEDGRGNNTGRVIESILGTWMSQNLSRDSDSLTDEHYGVLLIVYQWWLFPQHQK